MTASRSDEYMIKMLRQVATAIEAGRDGEPATFIINTGRVRLLRQAAARLDELTHAREDEPAPPAAPGEGK